MRLRKLALAVGLASALSAQLVSALGLAEIKLNSTLNQPLDAEIRLLQARDLSAQEILVDLASSADFQRAGVDRSFFLSDLSFEVVLDDPSRPYVRVTSKQPVREPYLNFLLETQWPSGRILREYTLLLDLPVFNEQPAQAVESTKVQPSAQPTYRSPKVQPVKPVEPPRQTRAASSSAQDDVYGPVGANDTLWQIALKVRPNRQVSVQQTMLAIQRMNPEAFINGNINLLRRGQVLRVPSANDINQVDGGQAVNEVAYQNSQWSSNDSEQPVAAQIDASKRITNTDTKPADIEGRIKLASATSNESAEGGQGQGAADNSGATEALQNELAISQEELDKVSRDNADLKDRIESLEDQIETMERLVEVSNEQMRALQLASQEAAESNSDAKSSLEESAAEAAVQELPAEAVAVAKPIEPTVKVSAEKPKKVSAPAKPAEKSLLDLLMDNLLYILAAIVAIAAAVFVLMRRRKEDEEFVGIEDIDDQHEDVLTDSVDEATEDESELELELEPEDEPEYLSGMDDADLSEEEDVAAQSQTDDALGEADVYIAYGKLDQAEDILLTALDDGNYQDETAVRLKLLEVYSEAEDLQKFDPHYALVMSSDDAGAKATASEYREKFADAPEFISPELDESLSVGDSADDADGLDFEGMDFSVDTPIDVDDEFSLDIDSTELEETNIDDEELSFDLSLDEETIESVESDFDLDLDFDLDEDLGPEVSLDDLDSELNADLDIEGLDEELENFELESSEPEPVSVIDVSDSEESAGSLLDSADDVSFDEADVNFDLDLDADFADLDAEMESLSSDTDFSSQEFDLDSEAADTKELSAEENTDAEGTEVEADFDAELDALDLSEGLELADELSDEDFDLDSELFAEMDDLAVADEELASEVTATDASDADEIDFDAELAGLSEELEAPAEDDEPEFDLAADLGLDEEYLSAAQSSEDAVFSQALSDLPTPEDVMAAEDDFGGDELGDELDFMADTDESATKLDLARAYIDMGDNDGAKDILSEVVEEGTDEQRQEAEELISRMS